MNEASTQWISIAAPPATVLDLVGDPMRLPEWAPEFALTVSAAGAYWLVESREATTLIRVRVDRELGIVDFLATGLPDGVEVGAFTRVVPNGAGSVYSFTQFLRPEDDARLRRAIVADELDTVRRLCEAARP